MSISRKLPPRMSDRDLQRAFSDLYKDINSIIDYLNLNSSDRVDFHKGNEGSVKILQDGNNYRVLYKAKDGWVEDDSANILNELLTQIKTVFATNEYDDETASSNVAPSTLKTIDSIFKITKRQ